jgi:hypothetical protein
MRMLNVRDRAALALLVGLMLVGATGCDTYADNGDFNNQSAGVICTDPILCLPTYGGYTPMYMYHPFYVYHSAYRSTTYHTVYVSGRSVQLPSNPSMRPVPSSFVAPNGKTVTAPRTGTTTTTKNNSTSKTAPKTATQPKAPSVKAPSIRTSRK